VGETRNLEPSILAIFVTGQSWKFFPQAFIYSQCLGKVLDKAIACQIQYEIAAAELVPFNQFGSCILSSTINAGLSFTQEIHDVWARKIKASALFFDISGFFNFINHNLLYSKLQHLGFNRHTINLIQ